MNERNKFWRKFCKTRDCSQNCKINNKVQEFLKENPELNKGFVFTKNFVFGDEEIFQKFKTKLEGVL